MLPPPSPRHNNAESKKQAQKSVRFLHSYICAGSEPQQSPHARRRYPQASLALVRGAREAAGGKDSLAGQSTHRAGLAARTASVCYGDKKK